MQKAKPVTAAVAAALIVCLGSTSLGAQPVLEKIVDSRDPVPGAPDASWRSIQPFFEVVLDGDEIAFIGSSNELDGFRDGVYLRRGGTLQVVADSETIRPGTGVPFGEGFWRAALDDGMLVFVNEDRSSQRGGVYRHGDGGLQVIADHTTPIPGGEPNHFLSFGDVAVHQGQVLFGAGTHYYFGVWHQDGLYRAAGGALTRVVDATTPIPGGSGSFELVGEVGMDASGFAFTMPHRDSTWEDGIYRSVGAGLQRVADLSTVAPHSGTPFESFDVFGYDARTVAFKAFAGGKPAIYLYDGELRVIASRQTPYPGSGQSFAGFANRLATSKGRVAFLGFRNPPGQPSQEGLFVADGGELRLIVEMGSVLDGRVVSEIDLSQGGFDWPHLAFTVAFAEGGEALFRYTAPGGDDPPPPAGSWLTAPELPGFRVKARFTTGNGVLAGQSVTPCIGETLCVAGALPDRAELFVRVVGPRPNGKLWPTLVKFSTSRIEVWIEQTESGVIRYYELPEVAPGEQLLRLDGLADKLGFDP
ncbi:MAG TPA: hypothetical protein VJ725_25190 [Thermoanaerobaculia bacterium]|nr:hypothetical protein [Thermoanaerobaculia bacterium]